MRWKLTILMVICLFLGLPALGWAQANTDLNKVTSFDVEEKEDGTYIRIRGSQIPTFSVFQLNEPLRLFVDVSNSSLIGDTVTKHVNNGVISQISMLEFEDSFQTVTRLILGFEQAAYYDMNTDGNDVVVFIDGAARAKVQPAISQTRYEEALRERDEVLRQREAKLAQAEAQFQAMEQRYRKELEQSRANYDQARGQLHQAQAQLESERTEKERMVSQLRTTTGKARDELQTAISQKERSLEQVQQSLEQREALVQQYHAQMEALKGERETEKRRMQSVREQLIAERDAAQMRADELSNQLASARQALKAAEAEKNKAQTHLEGVTNEARLTASQLQDYQARLQEAELREQQLQRQIKSLQQAKVAQESLESLERQARMNASQLQDYQARLQKAEQREQQLQGQIQSLEEANAAAKQQLVLEQQRPTNEQASQKTPAPTSRASARAVAIDPDSTNTVRAIRLELTEHGRSRIVVDLDRPSQFETHPRGKKRAVMILNDVQLPKHLEQTLSADAQGGAVRFVSTYNEGSGAVRMEAELRTDASEVIREDGNQLVWEFAPTITREAHAERLPQDAQPRAPQAGQSFTSSAPEYPTTVVDPSQVSHVPGMSRKRLTIDLRNADIQNVLRLLAKEGGVNIIAGQGVGGTVTMRLRSVPIDQVFLTILQSLQLGFEVRGNVIRVAPQAVLSREESARAEARNRAQRMQPLEVFLLPINYASATDLVPQIQGLLSSRGSVSVDERTNTLIIKDLRENLQSMRLLVESLDSQVPQVLIEARIVETNDVFARQIGIQWGGDMAFSQGNGNPTGLIFPSILGLGGGATDGQTPVAGTSSNPNFAVNLPAPAGTGAGGAIGLTMGSVGGGVNLNLRLSAMEEAGYAKIVTAPKILTLDNREASISQGTSIPISVVGAAGVQTTFVDATLELTVTPHVTPDGNVQMSIRATKNEPDFQNTGARGDPTIIRRQAETELLVKDGDTTVIGGIYTRNAGMSVSAVPFFHRIPILGFFFRTSSQSERRSELLIFITPRIVNRAESLGVMSAGSVTGDFARDEVSSAPE